MFLDYCSLKPATRLPTWSNLVYFWRYWVQEVLKTTPAAHLCPPCLSTMTRRVYTHANALATEAAQNGMAQRHHLANALVVSQKFLSREKENLSIWSFFNFDTSLLKDFVQSFPGWLFDLESLPRCLHEIRASSFTKRCACQDICTSYVINDCSMDPPTDPILDNPDYRAPLLGPFWVFVNSRGPVFFNRWRGQLYLGENNMSFQASGSDIVPTSSSPERPWEFPVLSCLSLVFLLARSVLHQCYLEKWKKCFGVSVAKS